MDLTSLGQTAFAGISNGTLYAFLGLGFGLVIRSTGLINFAQGDMMMLGGMLTAVISAAGVPVGIAAALAVAMCTASAVRRKRSAGAETIKAAVLRSKASLTGMSLHRPS